MQSEVQLLLGAERRIRKNKVIKNRTSVRNFFPDSEPGDLQKNFSFRKSCEFSFDPAIPNTGQVKINTDIINSCSGMLRTA